MNGKIFSLSVCTMVHFVVLWIRPASAEIFNPKPRTPPKQRIYLPYNDYVAVFGNRFENLRGRWKTARKLYGKGLTDNLRAICERAFSKTGSGFVKVDRAQVKLGFLTFIEPEYDIMVADILICEIENTESVEGSKAQFFLTRGKTEDAVYYLYPVDLEHMQFRVLTDRHVKKVVDPADIKISKKKNLKRSYRRRPVYFRL